jgi:hypothetical protein
VNKRDYGSLEREFISGDISLRELCRRHGISAHSSVVVQAQKGKWAEKRERYRARSSDAFITRHAERLADRQAEISDHALDAIDEAISKFREDMQATEKKRIDGEWIEVPVMRLMPKDLALLIDRLQVLFERPSVISQHQGLTVTSGIPVDTLRQFIELTRDAAAPTTKVVSPLPRSPRRLDD